jgi:hypothetical protein
MSIVHVARILVAKIVQSHILEVCELVIDRVGERGRVKGRAALGRLGVGELRR